MKVKIQKLGNIQNAEFDLRPLTIFVGPNNTGKTWLAYVLSAIFGSSGVRPYIQAYVENQLLDLYPPLEDAITEIITHSTYVVDHLGNLIEASCHERKEEIVEKFMLEREDAFIDPKKVSVYEITEKGEMENILSDDGVIDWKTFSDVTEWVQGIHLRPGP